MDKQNQASLMLRIALAFSFLYVAIFSFINPLAWIGFFPPFLQKSAILTLFSVYEIILGLWLLSGRKIFWAASLSAITIIGIIIPNIGAFDIIFRDVTILGTALALMLLTKKIVRQ